MVDLLHQKLALVYYHEWQTKDGAKWQVYKDGFSFPGSGEVGADKAPPECLVGIPKDMVAEVIRSPWKGITLETMRKWVEFPNIQPEVRSLARLVVFIAAYLKTEKIPTIRHLIDESISLKDFCLLFKATEEDMKRAIYSLTFFSNGPHLGYIVQEAGQTERIANQAAGLYIAHRLEPLQFRNRLTQMAIAVIAAVPVSARRDDNRRSILCRLAIPNHSEGAPYKYTGLLSYENDLLCWNFRQDMSPLRDVAFFMTDIGELSRPDVEREGKMITRAQGRNPRAITYDVIITRVQRAFRYDDIEPFLDKFATFDVKKNNGLRRRLEEMRGEVIEIPRKKRN